MAFYVVLGMRIVKPHSFILTPGTLQNWYLQNLPGPLACSIAHENRASELLTSWTNKHGIASHFGHIVYLWGVGAEMLLLNSVRRTRGKRPDKYMDTRFNLIIR